MIGTESQLNIKCTAGKCVCRQLLLLLHWFLICIHQAAGASRRCIMSLAPAGMVGCQPCSHTHTAGDTQMHMQSARAPACTGPYPESASSTLLATGSTSCTHHVLALVVA